MARFTASGTFAIQLRPYVWAVRQLPVVSNTHAKRIEISVAVSAQGVSGQELYIDFPVSDYYFTPPKDLAVFEARIIACTTGALLHGWVPTDKGKPYRVSSKDVEKLPARS